MCGIVGYIGKGNGVPYLQEGLKLLEYRGYDSAGIAVHTKNSIQVAKKKGKIAMLDKEIRAMPKSTLGIAHNRWATHGEPSDINAHPHLSQHGKVAIVHNGIIENYLEIKENLMGRGVEFQTETDSEVIAQLIEFYMLEDPELSLRDGVMKMVETISGTYGILVIHADYPDTLIGVRNGSPLCFGIGDKEFIVASDVLAFATYFSKVVHMEDREMVVIENGTYMTSHFERGEVAKTSHSIDREMTAVTKGGYEHYMLKEICEQPESVKRAMRGRLMPEEGTCKLGGINMEIRDFLDIDHICFIGCGTSYHAGLLGVYLMESLARVPSTAEVAPELKCRNPIVRKNTLYIGISQSGETADTNIALREILNKGGHAIGICNVVGSSMARMLGAGIYLHAGVEVSVCSTKAFTSQITAVYLLSILLARSKDLSEEKGIRLVSGLQKIPEQIQQVLDRREEVHRVAKKYIKFQRYLYMGRGINYPVALEGALKLKEIAYVFADGYSSSEMKHGAIALIDKECASFFVTPDDELRSKNLSNMAEVKSRGGPIIAVATEGDKEIAKMVDDVFFIPETEPELTPFLSIVYLQLFSYYISLELGNEIDQPRNLAKSVTVE